MENRNEKRPTPKYRVVQALWKEGNPPERIAEIELFDKDPETGKELTRSRATELRREVILGGYFNSITEVIEEDPS